MLTKMDTKTKQNNSLTYVIFLLWLICRACKLNRFLYKHWYFCPKLFIKKNNRENWFFVFFCCIYVMHLLADKHKAQILFQSASPKQSNELMFQNIFLTDAFLANICCTRSEHTHQLADSAVLSRYDSLHTSNKIIPFRLQYFEKKGTTVITTVDKLLLKMKELQKGVLKSFLFLISFDSSLMFVCFIICVKWTLIINENIKLYLMNW